jgi:hypothetical protein
MHTRRKSFNVGTRYLCSPILLHNPVKERHLDMGLTASQAQDPPLKKFSCTSKKRSELISTADEIFRCSLSLNPT